MTMKAHTYYIIFRRPPIWGGSFPPSLYGGATEHDSGRRTDLASRRRSTVRQRQRQHGPTTASSAATHTTASCYTTRSQRPHRCRHLPSNVDNTGYRMLVTPCTLQWTERCVPIHQIDPPIPWEGDPSPPHTPKTIS